MYSINFAAVCAAAIAIVLSAAISGAAGATDLMNACEADIAEICPKVAKGRGRIAACLIAYDHRLSGRCRIEVDKMSQSHTYRRFVPATLRSDRGPELEADLRRVCTSDIGRLCPGVKAGKGRILACLYSRSNNVGKACSSAAKQVADGRMNFQAN